MAPAAVTVPNVLSSPGFLFIAPLLSVEPVYTVAGSVFTDAWPAPWLPLGATEDGSELHYTITTQPVHVSEFLDPIKYFTTDRSGGLAFSLANWGLGNYRRALNGGVAALAPVSGTGATALYQVAPPVPGSEVRCMLGWESLDSTVRLVIRQAIQGGEIKTSFKKPPVIAAIPCAFNMEVPAALDIFTLSSAGASRA